MCRGVRGLHGKASQGIKDGVKPVPAPHLLVVVLREAGEAAVLVHQEAEAPLLLQERLSAALRDEPLDLALARGDRFYVLGKQEQLRSVTGGTKQLLSPAFISRHLYTRFIWIMELTAKHR